MQSTNEHSFSLPAWALSLGFHGGVVWLALLFTAQVEPILNEEVFQWNVALVETAKMDSSAQPTAEPAAPPMPPVARRVPSQARTTPSSVEPLPDIVNHRVAPQRTVQMMHPEVQPPKPLEQREEPSLPTKVEQTPPPVTAVPEKTIEPVEQQVAETSKMKESEPVTAQHQPVAPSLSEAVDTRPVQTPAPPAVSEPVASSTQVEPPPISSTSPSSQEAPVEMAKAAPVPAAQPQMPSSKSGLTSAEREAPVETAKAPPGSDVKTDHRWLAESLWRRVAELKRYPNSARLNGQEGKVVLKAVIRSDGHLLEVTVQKSSGHQILDAAAMEAVKLACPLHMKHAINKAEIVVSLPIVYSLSN